MAIRARGCWRLSPTRGGRSLRLPSCLSPPPFLPDDISLKSRFSPADQPIGQLHVPTTIPLEGVKPPTDPPAVVKAPPIPEGQDPERARGSSAPLAPCRTRLVREQDGAPQDPPTPPSTQQHLPRAAELDWDQPGTQGPAKHPAHQPSCELIFKLLKYFWVFLFPCRSSRSAQEERNNCLYTQRGRAHKANNLLPLQLPPMLSAAPTESAFAEGNVAFASPRATASGR